MQSKPIDKFYNFTIIFYISTSTLPPPQAYVESVRKTKTNFVHH